MKTKTQTRKGKAMTLTDQQLNGNVAVRVMNTTIGGKQVLEGQAIIRKVREGDRQGVYADVEFPDDPGLICRRWVFASDQK